jgi:hypothetical protein
VYWTRSSKPSRSINPGSRPLFIHRAPCAGSPAHAGCFAGLILLFPGVTVVLLGVRAHGGIGVALAVVGFLLIAASLSVVTTTLRRRRDPGERTGLRRGCRQSGVCGLRLRAATLRDPNFAELSGSELSAPR